MERTGASWLQVFLLLAFTSKLELCAQAAKSAVEAGMLDVLIEALRSGDLMSCEMFSHTNAGLYLIQFAIYDEDSLLAKRVFTPTLIAALTHCIHRTQSAGCACAHVCE
jgi:hypothetical protein